MKQLLTPALALSLAVAPVVTQAADPSEVKSFTLDNGMKVLVLEDDAIPNANMYLFWKVGSRNEVPGITGLSHFFEHMMFNGSKNYGPKMFDRTMEAAGGANNAYTTENVTVYTDWFPAEALETIFKLESDRIAHLNIDANMVESERNVVASERTTGLENSNWRALQEEVKATAFRAHPYSWSVIGHESDIYAWTLDDLKQYHKTYYAPNNAVVVIAGAVDYDQVKQMSEHYFGAIPAQTPPAEVRTVEPEQKGERRVYVRKESVTSPNLMFAYHVPQTSHQDSYALDVLMSLLIDGNSSRLNKALVDEQQIALGVDGYVPQSFDPNLLYLFAVAKPGVAAATLEQSLIAEISKVAQEGVTQEELDKVKNSKLMGFYDTLETINGRANTLGTYELFQGDWKKMYTAPEAYAKITREDVQRVAQTYLKKSNRTVGVLAAEEDKD
ncbi:M16 family metallopeptidase [Ferrimonas futtsuensis]|uniref:M16 family metallopeptidase n=1 Tax=Ferrimonas futtsuensis TaxID=364764 RepID=UPI0003FD266E